MSAQRCFTPWNWPIGRPNWTRAFAYSAAVSTHHCATPMASAAKSTAAIWCTRSVVIARRRPGSPRPGSIRTTGRVGSTLWSGVRVTASASQRVPRALDLAHEHVGAAAADNGLWSGQGDRARAFTGREFRDELAPGRPRRRAPRPRRPSGRTDPGAAARPSSSTTIACSTRPNPAPPLASLTWSASQPGSRSAAQNGGSSSRVGVERGARSPRG